MPYNERVYKWLTMFLIGGFVVASGAIAYFTLGPSAPDRGDSRYITLVQRQDPDAALWSAKATEWHVRPAGLKNPDLRLVYGDYRPDPHKPTLRLGWLVNTRSEVVVAGPMPVEVQ